MIRLPSHRRQPYGKRTRRRSRMTGLSKTRSLPGWALPRRGPGWSHHASWCDGMADGGPVCWPEWQRPHRPGWGGSFDWGRSSP